MDNAALTPEEHKARRDERLLTRRYFTVALSDKVIPEGIAFRCWQCGMPVSTVYNEPKAQIEIKIAQEDVIGKLVGNLCRKDNIFFLFV